MDNITLMNGDCLEEMKKIPDKSVQLILCDLPYGTTARNDWDHIIPMDQLWAQYNRIIKDNGVIALWSQIPFSGLIMASNPSMLRYEWIIEKTKATGHLNAKKMPMKAHENVLIFYKKLPKYNPQKTTGHSPVHSFTKHTDDGTCYGNTQSGVTGGGSTERYPRDVLKFKWDTQQSKLHPTQKPVAACEYFIRTYTDEGDVVLDNCMGSGTTGVACVNTGRKFIGIELNKEFFDIANRRISEVHAGTH